METGYGGGGQVIEPFLTRVPKRAPRPCAPPDRRTVSYHLRRHGYSPSKKNVPESYPLHWESNRRLPGFPGEERLGLPLRAARPPAAPRPYDTPKSISDLVMQVNSDTQHDTFEWDE